MGKIIGICNQKGGTGKTTTAINISAYLALGGAKVLLIDLDPQGNASSGVGFDDTEALTVYEGLISHKPPGELIVSTKWDNLDLIPASISLTGAEIELVQMEYRERKLKEFLSHIREEYEYIIIDAPPSLGLLTVNVLVASDSLLIPIQCEYYALEGVSKLINTIELIKDRLNPDLTIEGVLLTMADFRTRLTLQVIREVKNFFKEKTFRTIIPRNVKLAEAPSFGKPMPFYHLNCVGAKAYFNLAQEVAKKKFEIPSLINNCREGG